MSDKKDGSQMNPMGMMKKMMGGGGPPMEMCMSMCKQMTQSIERTGEMAAYATPELRGLFETWLEEVEQEAMKFVAEKDSVSAHALAEKLGISRESAIFIIARLAKSGKVEASAKKGADSEKETRHEADHECNQC